MDVPTESQRSRRRRFRVVAIVVAVLAAVAAVPFAIRAHGRSLLAEVRARHAAAGLGVSARDLADSLPPVDADLVRRCDSLERAVQRAIAQQMVIPPTVNDWIVGARSDPPPELDAELARLQPEMEALADVLRGEGLLLGVAGHLPRREAASRLRWKDVVSIHISNLLVQRQAAVWIRFAALRSEDPGPYLDALDGQRKALLHPASLIDAMIALAMLGERDRAYADLVLRGRLPPDRVARWLAEEPEHLRLSADGFRGERLLFGVALADGLTNGTFGAKDLAGGPSGPRAWGRNLGLSLEIWLYGMRDAARVLEAGADMEDRLRGGPGTIDPARLAGWLEDGDTELSMFLPNTHAAEASARDSRTLHRMARVLVRTLGAAKERGRLPTDETELRAWLGAEAVALDPGPIDVAIRYESVSPGVLRLFRAPPGPIPVVVGGPVVRRAIHWAWDGIEVHLAK